MGRETKIKLGTRHISCLYCIAISVFTVSIILFGLSSQQSTILNNHQNRVPVIITASIILILSVIIFLWISYYAIGYYRSKRSEQINHSQNQKNDKVSEVRTTVTPVIIFDNAVFTMDDPLFMNSPANNQTSA